MPARAYQRRNCVEVDARCVLHRRDEVVAGDRLAVVALEIQIHAAPEAVAPEQGVHHADDFRALVVDGGGVEIVDLGVGGGPDRVRHRPRVFGELADAQAAHFLDAGDRARMRVGAEFLVAEHGEAFLQRQLEPVAAGDAVAGPVVEILVRHHAVDALVVGVGRGVRAGQHVLGVEDVEALVFHRAHVEVADRDDHVAVEVVFQAEALLVPAHGFFQRRHRVAALVELAGFDVDFQLDRAARSGGEAVFQHVELGRDQREQIRGLGEGVFPAHPVPRRSSSHAPAATGLPLDSRCGKRARSASTVQVKFAITSGRSGKKVMRRKPSASHWVK